MSVVGIDLGTQSIKFICLNISNYSLIHEESVHFDTELTNYHTNGGVIRKDNNTVISPTLMWVESLDILFTKLEKSTTFKFESVIAISFSAQQHGSVYWKNGAKAILSSLDSSKSLKEQCQSLFFVNQSPVWMDSSTNCIVAQKIKNLIGGPEKMMKLSGSKCFERFTIHQITKIMRTSKSTDNLERISLVSSFLSTLFIGDYAPIDYADGSGMNVLNIRNKTWIDEVLDYSCSVTRGLQLLGNVVPSYQVLGPISSYWKERYHFSDNCYIVAGSGDNPCTYAAIKPNPSAVIISLGTSDTIFAPISDPLYREALNVLCSPLDPTGYLGMVCRKNGSLARDQILNQFCYSDWSQFDQLLKKTQPGNLGYIGFYFIDMEIFPTISGTFLFDSNDKKIESFPSPEINIRAILESQAIILYIFSNSMLMGKEYLIVVGGGSENLEFLQILSDVFGIPVIISKKIKNAAAVGAAFRAYHGWKCFITSSYIGFNEVIGNLEVTRTIEPIVDNNRIYMELLPRYKRLLDTLNLIKH